MKIDSDSASHGWTIDDTRSIYTPTFPTTIIDPHNWRVFGDAVNLCTAVYERVRVLRYANVATAPSYPSIPASTSDNICKRSWLLSMQEVFTTEAIYAEILDPNSDSTNDFLSIADVAATTSMSAYEYFCKEVAGLFDPETDEWGFRYSNSISDDGNRIVQYPSSNRTVAHDDYLHPANMEDIIAAAESLTTFIMPDGWSWYLDSTVSKKTTSETTTIDPFDGDTASATAQVVSGAASGFVSSSTSSGTPSAYFEIDLEYHMLYDSTTAEGTGYGWGQASFLGATVPYAGNIDFYIHVLRNGDNFDAMGSGYSVGWNLISVDEDITSEIEPEAVYSEVIGLSTPSIGSFVLDLDPPNLEVEVDVVMDPIDGREPDVDADLSALVYIGTDPSTRLDVTDNPVITIDWYSVVSAVATYSGTGNPYTVENLNIVNGVDTFTYRGEAIAFKGVTGIESGPATDDVSFTIIEYDA